MYLHNPTISELQLLELPLLLEMLAHQTEEYLEFLKLEGYTTRTRAAKEAVVNIQLVIQAKEAVAKRLAKKTDILSHSQGRETKPSNKRSH